MHLDIKCFALGSQRVIIFPSREQSLALQQAAIFEKLSVALKTRGKNICYFRCLDFLPFVRNNCQIFFCVTSTVLFFCAESSGHGKMLGRMSERCTINKAQNILVIWAIYSGESILRTRPRSLFP